MEMGMYISVICHCVSHLCTCPMRNSCPRLEAAKDTFQQQRGCKEDVHNFSASQILELDSRMPW